MSNHNSVNRNQLTPMLYNLTLNAALLIKYISKILHFSIAESHGMG